GVLADDGVPFHLLGPTATSLLFEFECAPYPIEGHVVLLGIVQHERMALIGGWRMVEASLHARIACADSCGKRSPILGSGCRIEPGPHWACRGIGPTCAQCRRHLGSLLPTQLLRSFLRVSPAVL